MRGYGLIGNTIADCADKAGPLCDWNEYVRRHRLAIVLPPRQRFEADDTARPGRYLGLQRHANGVLTDGLMQGRFDIARHTRRVRAGRFAAGVTSCSDVRGMQQAVRCCAVFWPAREAERIADLDGGAVDVDGRAQHRADAPQYG